MGNKRVKKAWKIRGQHFGSKMMAANDGSLLVSTTKQSKIEVLGQKRCTHIF